MSTSAPARTASPEPAAGARDGTAGGTTLPDREVIALHEIPRPLPGEQIVDLADRFGSVAGLMVRYAEWADAAGGTIMATGGAPFVDVTGMLDFRAETGLTGRATLNGTVSVLGLPVASVTRSVPDVDPQEPLLLPRVQLDGGCVRIDAPGWTLTPDPRMTGGDRLREGSSERIGSLVVDLASALPSSSPASSPAEPGAEGSPATPIPPGTAALLAALLGERVDALQIRSDPGAAGVTADLEADAVTAGTDILLGAGATADSTPSGARLLGAAVRQVLAGIDGPVTLDTPLPDPAQQDVAAPTDGVGTVVNPAQPDLPTVPEADALDPAADPDPAHADPTTDPTTEGQPDGVEVGAPPPADAAEADGAAVVELIMPPAPTTPGPAQQERATRVSAGARRAGRAARALPTSNEATEGARGAVTEPTAETAARARAELAEELGERPQPSPEILELCDRIRTAIRERRPVDEDELLEADPTEAAAEAGGTLNDSIESDAARVEGEYASINEPAQGAPALTPAPVPEVESGVSDPGIDAASAAPDPVPAEDLSLDADVERVDAQVAESRIHRPSAEPIQEAPFTTVRDAQSELGEIASTSPAEVAAQQQQAIDQAQADMGELQQRALTVLRERRAGTVAGTAGQQADMVGSEEQTREGISRQATEIFDGAQRQVNELLDPLGRNAISRWDAGVERLSTQFRSSLNRVQEWVDDRHSGVGGFFVAGWDALTGLPGWVTDEYDRAERRFGDGVCDLLVDISRDVNSVTAAAEAVIEDARSRINRLFDDLPQELQEWAATERGRFETRLDGLHTEVQEAQTTFVDDISERAVTAVAEVQAEIEQLREAARGVIGRIADAIGDFLDDPVRAIINGLLSLVGIPPTAFWALVARIQQVIADIADDPESFINNLVDGLRQGFERFFDNFGTHVLNGFWEWLFSGLGSVGVQIPSDFSLGSLVTFVLQVMGITWPRVREILVRHIGEENVALIEQAWELVSLLIERGPEGIFEMLRERLDPATILETILDAAIDFLIETLIEQVVIRVVGMLNPVGAVAQAIELIYKVLRWVFENAARIFRLVETVVNGIADVIAGRIGPMAAAVEGALAGLVPVVIDFLAGLLGLGDLPDEIADVIRRLQEVVLEGLDLIIGFLVARAQALLAAIGLGGDDDEEDDDDAPGGDDELGKTVRFSAAGERHRHWIDISGSDAVLMVASVPESIDSRISRWEDEVSDLPEESHDEANSLLGSLRTLVDSADDQADQLAEAFAAASALGREDAEPLPSDDSLENRQEAIARLLDRIFELFDEEIDEEGILADIAAVLPGAGTDRAREVQDYWDNNVSEVEVGPPHLRVQLFPAGQSPFTGAIEASAVGYLAEDAAHRQLINYFTISPGERDADTASFRGYALVQSRPTPAHAVRRGFLERMGEAAAEAIRARGQARAADPTLSLSDEERQELSEQMGRVGYELGPASPFGRFSELRERPPDHRWFEPQALQRTGQSLHYTTETGQTFDVVLNDQGVPETIDGASLRQFSGRGVTQDSPFFSQGQGFNRAHGIANRFGGSGFSRGGNLVTTSAHYNQVEMAGAEDRIAGVIDTFGGPRRTDVTFDLQVRLGYVDMTDESVLEKIRAAGIMEADTVAEIRDHILARIQAANIADELDRVKFTIYQVSNMTLDDATGPNPTENLDEDLWILTED